MSAGPSCSPCLSLAPCATSRRPLNTTITTPVPRCVGNVHLPQQAQTSAPTTGSNASQSITGDHGWWKNGSSSKTLLPLWSKSLTARFKTLKTQKESDNSLKMKQHDTVTTTYHYIQALSTVLFHSVIKAADRFSTQIHLSNI